MFRNSLNCTGNNMIKVIQSKVLTIHLYCYGLQIHRNWKLNVMEGNKSFKAAYVRILASVVYSSKKGFINLLLMTRVTHLCVVKVLSCYKYNYAYSNEETFLKHFREILEHYAVILFDFIPLHVILSEFLLSFNY